MAPPTMRNKGNNLVWRQSLVIHDRRPRDSNRKYNIPVNSTVLHSAVGSVADNHEEVQVACHTQQKTMLWWTPSTLHGSTMPPTEFQPQTSLAICSHANPHHAQAISTSNSSLTTHQPPWLRRGCEGGGAHSQIEPWSAATHHLPVIRFRMVYENLCTDGME